jgi:hypothetical protein
MNIKILTPAFNPFRFRGSVGIDYTEGKMPQFDLMELGIKYQKGIEALSFFPDWLSDREINIQIQIETASGLSDSYLVNLETGESTPVIAVNITPAGWIGYKVFKLSVTPPSDGYYNIFFEYYSAGISERILSDNFIVRESDMDIVEIDYKNSINKFGFVFDDYYKICFTGQSVKDTPGNEITLFTDSSGEPRKQDSRPQKYAILYLTEFHRFYLDILNNIISVNDIKINDIGYETPNNLEFEPSDDSSDVGTVTIKLIEKENNYMLKI